MKLYYCLNIMLISLMTNLTIKFLQYLYDLNLFGTGLNSWFQDF